MVQLTPLSPVKGNSSPLWVKDNITKTDIVVNNDTFTDTCVIDNSNYKKIFMLLFNSHASKGLIYQIFGNANFNNGVPPDTDATWKELTTTGGITVAAQAFDAQSLSDDYCWLLFKFKRATAGGGNDSSAKLYSEAVRQ